MGRAYFLSEMDKYTPSGGNKGFEGITAGKRQS